MQPVTGFSKLSKSQKIDWLVSNHLNSADKGAGLGAAVGVAVAEEAAWAAAADGN